MSQSFPATTTKERNEIAAVLEELPEDHSARKAYKEGVDAIRLSTFVDGRKDFACRPAGGNERRSAAGVSPGNLKSGRWPVPLSQLVFARLSRHRLDTALFTDCLTHVGTCFIWRPHGDSNPGYRRERAMS